MATIDDKVVAMSFESSKFEQGVNNTISALDKLKKALHFPGAGKGLDDINAASKRVDLSHIGNAIDSVKGKFQALSVAAGVVLANLASKAISAGTNFVKAFTLDPAKAGFTEYATNLNAVQTILANTAAAGTKLTDVNAALKELNDYSDKTIYNFSQMAKNIGTFTAAGVDLDTATGAIKGIANLAALSGSNAEQASTAMYQLSQAISAGRVSLQDWNSVVNAGMGGTVFQRALAQTAEAMGTLKEGTVKLEGPMKNVSIAGESFRQSISAGPGKESWLTSKVLTATLEQFTGDLSKAELKAQGFNDAQIKAIQQTANTAMHAATEVKTLSQVLDVAKETAASGWAQTWQIIFGDFSEAKKTFTSLSNTINGFINANADARNKVLADWKELGGRTVLIEGIKAAFESLMAILKPIKEAFREIFPATTGKDLYDLTVRFKELAEALKPSPATADLLKRSFAGLFAVLDIGKQLIGGIFTAFKQVFDAVAGGSGSFLEITANIGDFLVSVDQALKKGDGLHNFFVGLGNVLAKPVELLGKLAEAIANLFSGFSSGGFSSQIDGMTQAMTPFQKVMAEVTAVWDSFAKSMGEVGKILQPLIEAILTGIAGLGTAIGHAASNMSFEPILQVIRTGLLGGIFLMFKKFLGKGSLLDQLGGAGGGFIKNISGMFDALRGSMEAMQQNIKADTLQKIAIAIGVLTASIIGLSLVDPKKLNQALGGIAVAMGELLGAMAILQKISISGGFLKVPIVAAGMIALAAAVDVLSIAIFALSKLSWGELVKGLTGVGGAMATLVVAVKPLSASSAGLIRAGIGLTGIAIALRIMASAVSTFAQLGWGAMAKGLAGVAAGLTALAAASNAMPSKGMIAAGVGLIAIATGLKILAGVVEQFASMNWSAMGKGLAGVAGSLAILAVAMNAMPANTAITAAGLLLVALALGKITSAVQQMGGMSLGEIARGLGTLAGSLTILAAALYAMTGSLAGAAALGVAALGISMLATALVKMGDMSWGEMLKSFIVLAGALTAIGVAGALLTPVIPSLLGLGAALLLIGGGLALAGAGIALVGVGLSAIAVAGPTAIGILVAALDDLIEAAIKAAKNLILGLLEIVDALAETAPKFVDALVKIGEQLVNVVIRLTPKIVEAFQVLLDAVLKLIKNNQDKIIQAGFDLVMALLKGIEKNLPAIVTTVADIIAKFLSSLANNLSKIIAAGGDLLTAFIKGIIQYYGHIVTTVVDVIAKFIEAVAGNLGKIVTAGLSVLTAFLGAIADNLGKVITAAKNVVTSFIEGIGAAAGDVVRSAVDTMIKFINTIQQESNKLINAGMVAIVNFLNGVAAAINAHAGEIRAAGMNVGFALINGMTAGLAGQAAALYSKISGIMDHAMSLVHKIPLIGSPSKVTTDVGENIILGLVKGLDENAHKVYDSVETVSYGLINGMKDIFEIRSPSRVMMEIGDAVGQGFAVGLKGSQDDIRKAFEDMNSKLTDAMRDARENIVEEQRKLGEERKKAAEQQAELDKLRDAKKPDKDAIKRAQDDLKATQENIKEIQAVLTANQDILERTTDGHNALVKTLKDEKKELIDLAGQYEDVSTKLEDAQKNLDDLIKERADLVKSTTAQYGALPELDTTTDEEIAKARKNVTDAKKELSAALAEKEVDQEKVSRAQLAVAEQQNALKQLLAGKALDSAGNSVDQLATYEDALKHQTTAIGAYNSTLQQLRKLGLDDATYQKLVDDGVADQAFAKQLLAGGKNAVDKLNKLDSNLQTVSNRLGTNVGNNMKTAGIKAARGIVEGLDEEKGDIYRKMREIGAEMVAQLKRELKIKSPSQIFMEIGQYSMEGMADGFTKSTYLLQDATDKVAADAVAAMKRSMRDIHGAVISEIDTNPVITPVLDLTTIQGQARTLNGMLPASVSYGAASTISAGQVVTPIDEATAAIGSSVIFNQNNYSPESLSEIEIYRQTRNQMAQLKSALAIT